MLGPVTMCEARTVNGGVKKRDCLANYVFGRVGGSRAPCNNQLQWIQLSADRSEKTAPLDTDESWKMERR